MTRTSSRRVRPGEMERAAIRLTARELHGVESGHCLPGYGQQPANQLRCPLRPGVEHDHAAVGNRAKRPIEAALEWKRLVPIERGEIPSNRHQSHFGQNLANRRVIRTEPVRKSREAHLDVRRCIGECGETVGELGSNPVSGKSPIIDMAVAVKPDRDVTRHKLSDEIWVRSRPTSLHEKGGRRVMFVQRGTDALQAAERILRRVVSELNVDRHNHRHATTVSRAASRGTR